MWADNETRIDLLGFDYFVDGLEVVLTEPRLSADKLLLHGRAEVGHAQAVLPA